MPLKSRPTLHLTPFGMEELVGQASRVGLTPGSKPMEGGDQMRIKDTSALSNLFGKGFCSAKAPRNLWVHISLFAKQAGTSQQNITHAYLVSN